jgi:hypothetical protein
MSSICTSIAVEGWSDESVVARLAKDHGLDVTAVYGKRGKHHLDRSLSGFNAAAKFANWLVVRDLDHDAECAAAFVRKRLPHPSPRMTYRVAVRAFGRFARTWLPRATAPRESALAMWDASLISLERPGAGDAPSNGAIACVAAPSESPPAAECSDV